MTPTHQVDMFSDCSPADLIAEMYVELQQADKTCLAELARRAQQLADEAKQNNSYPVAGEALFIAGFCYGELDCKQQALAAYQEAIECGFRRAGLFFNLGNCYRELLKPDKALESYSQALLMEPGRGDVIANMAFAYEDLGDLIRAEECFRRGYEIMQANSLAVHNLSYSLLRRGKYKEGWQLYELRSKSVPHELLKPTWDGQQDVADKRVLAVVEQGYGDVIMFCGLINELASQAESVMLICDLRMESLLQSSLPRITVSQLFVPSQLDQWDIRLAIGSLGKIYRSVDRKDFSPITPYLAPDPRRCTEVMKELRKLGNGLKIGIAWRGGDNQHTKKRRSIPLANMEELLRLEGILWINLQHHYDQDEVNCFTERTGIQLHHVLDATGDLEGLAAAVTCLDHVVSVQQTLVHFAGATGTPAEVMIPAVPEWRYGMEGEHMPWWQSVRLHRQHELGNWAIPIQSVTSVIAGLRNQRSKSGIH